MWRTRTQSANEPPATMRRDRLAVLSALATLACLALSLIIGKGTEVLMPGPLTSVHGAIENCSACHSKSGNSKLSWVHGLVAGDAEADSKACIACHKMPETAFNAHSATASVLKQSNNRLTQVAAQTPAPPSARAQDTAFPAHDVMARSIPCATCHQEHQGAGFKLNKISNEQCRSCHVVKFDSFDGLHPKFENYPFKRRTRITFDHAGHFNKHYPEVAKKDPTKRIPETCSTCHNSRDDKRVMAVAPFDQTCSGCHRDQILGKGRATGPKGIAFLSLPGLDMPTLKKKNAAIGEWPNASDAPLTPFMKVMLSRNERGRALLKTVDDLNLQDLSTASDDQIKAVTDLAWEVKRIFYVLINGKASDVLGDLNIGDGAKLSASVVADLTANIPRDVVISAQLEWLPSLATEAADRLSSDPQKRTGWGTEGKESKLAGTASPEELFGPTTRQPAPVRVAQAGEPGNKPEDKKASGASEEEKEGPSVDEQGRTRWELDNGTPRSIGERKKEKEKPDEAPKKDKANGDRNDAPASDAADAKNDKAGGGSDAAADKSDGAKASGEEGKATSAAAPPPGDPKDQSDDLLFPTEEELRGSGGKATQAAGQPESPAARADADKANDAKPSPGSPAGDTTADPAASQAKATAPVVTIASDIDPESWAEYGGWYRQDYAIYYRPTGHKDKFIYAWLYLTGPQAPRGDKTPVAAVFDFLTGKEAQGSCTKCHSVDDIRGKGRLVNFSPPSVESKRGRFTNFIHEPHFGQIEKRAGENRGCLSCHSLENGRPYLKSYEQGDPHEFVSNFGEVKKDLCQSCHNANLARQDCTLCHKYHIDGVVTPIINTKIPAQ